MMYKQKNIILITAKEGVLGFTLIEMLVSMTMGLLILAGLTSMFVSMNDASRSVASRSDRMGDLYLASHIMQNELRESQALCWDATKNRIIYQPLDSSVTLDSTVCNVVDATHGSFEFRPAKTGKPTPYICWNLPNNAQGCQELMRDMFPSIGLVVVVPTPPNEIWTVTLTSRYLNENKVKQPLNMRFKIWKRN